ncbi:MAG: hypothetical protein ASARMPREDX12_005584 [Alectoria sarmentosa]|nr:MAG: hypothetical protein ASARMPREDX12_005584 [Alectoria sarmentosa]
MIDNPRMIRNKSHVAPQNTEWLTGLFPDDGKRVPALGSPSLISTTMASNQTPHRLPSKTPKPIAPRQTTSSNPPNDAKAKAKMAAELHQATDELANQLHKAADSWQASLVDAILLEVKIVIENIKKGAESHA